MSEFRMPSLGADMESGTLVEWLVKPGDRVHNGEVVVVVETQKGAIEVEIFESGVVTELCVREGEKVPVGAVLARLNGAAAEPAAVEPAVAEPTPVEAPAAAPVPALAPERRPPEPKPSEPPPPVAAPAGRVKVTPVARRRAAERGIDPDRLTGTGVEGSVTLADVEAADAEAAAVPAAPAERTAAPRRGGFDAAEMRRAIAAAMSRSKREIPHYYLAQTIDLGRALAWLAEHNAARTPDRRLLPAVLLLKAAALALREVPQLNGFWEEGAFRPGPGIHVGWAIALRGGGLVAPAIRDTDSRSLDELMEALRDLVARARSGGLRSSELASPTITVTSLGDRGAASVLGVIYPPQVAILGFGRIAERPWVVEGAVVPRPLVDISLSGDHRAGDGHQGGLLLAAVERLLQEPEKL